MHRPSTQVNNSTGKEQPGRVAERSACDYARRKVILHERPISIPVKIRAAFVALAALWASALVLLYTRHNDFPTVYHPDEQFKGKAIVEGKFKFTQPLLLTSTAGAASWISAQRHTVQQAVVVGRWTSAVFAALAVALLAWAAGWQFGPWAGVAVAVALGSSHRLLIWAHYMKEDTALLLGLAAFLLAVAAYCAKPTRGRLTLLGCACGLSLAGKYVGILTFPLAWYAVRSVARGQGGPIDLGSTGQRPAAESRSLGPFVMGCAAVLLLVQIPALLHPIDFFDDLYKEIRHPITAHRGLAQPRLWNSPFWAMYVNEVPWFVAALGGAFAVISAVRWRRQSVFIRVMLMLAGAYWLGLLCASFAENRHVLPVAALSHAFAGLALASVIEKLPRVFGIRAAALLVGAALFVVPSVRPARACLDEFRRDTRMVLAEWIARNLRPEDAVAFESYAALPDDDAMALGAFAPVARLKQRLVSAQFLPDLGRIEEIRALGCEYVAVAETSWARYFSPGVAPQRKHRGEFQWRREWYERLFKEAELVVEIRPGIDLHANSSPVVRLYRLRAAPPQTRPNT